MDDADPTVEKNSVALRRVAVLMTSFNRRDLTLQSIAALEAAAEGRVDYEVFLVDDRSRDGTAEAAATLGPRIHVIEGTGTLYWNGGMRRAWTAALESRADFYVWLNDDVILNPGSLSGILDHYRQQQRSRGERVIVVGRTVSSATGEITYGGYGRAPGVSRLRLRRLRDDEQECYCMNGNFVLIPAIAATEVGVNSNAFRHSFGDHDYAFRARRKGYSVVEWKTPVAMLEPNPDPDWNNKSWVELARFVTTHPKGVPIGEWWRFCRLYGGPLAPVNFLLRYARALSRRGPAAGA